LSVSLHLALDVFVTRKLSMPDNPEYAIGALSETGAIYLNPEAVEAFHLSRADLEEVIGNARQELARRQQLYRKGSPLAPIRDKTVILVDDGIATGATFFATIEAVQERSPRRLIAAIPVAPLDTVALVRSRVHELIVLETPGPFIAVGHHYHNFAQTDDAQVLAYLKAARHSQKRTAAPG
jgi:putative phosphoribosyl transferase